MKDFDYCYWEELGDLRNYKAYVGFGKSDMYTPTLHCLLNEKVPLSATSKRVALVTFDPFNPRLEKVFTCSTVMPQRRTDSNMISEWLQSNTDFVFPSFFMIGPDGVDGGYTMLYYCLIDLPNGKAYSEISKQFLHNQTMRGKPLSYFNVCEDYLRPLTSEETDEYVYDNLTNDITMEGMKSLLFAWSAACDFHYGKSCITMSQINDLMRLFFR